MNESLFVDVYYFCVYKLIGVKELRLVLFFVFIGTVQLYSVELDKVDLTFRTLTIQDGLTQNTVICVFQDHRGFIWLGTEDGLNKYDGRKIVAYMPAINNPQTIQGGAINAIVEDDSGFIYFAASGGGISVYDPQTGLFKHMTENSPDSTLRIPSNFVFDLAIHPNGTIWFISGVGLTRFNPSTKTMDHFNFKKGDLFDGPSAIKLFIDKDGSVWVSVFAMGLYQFNPDTKEFHHIVISDQSENQRKVNTIRSIVSLDNDNFLLGTDGGVIKFNKLSKKFESYLDIKYSVNALLKDSKGNVWVGSSIEKIVTINPQGEKYQLSTDTYDSKNIPEHFVETFYEDSNGGLWFGLKNKGVALTNLYNKPFLHVYHSPFVNSLPGNEIFAIAEGCDHDVWIGTMNGLSKWNRTTKTFTNYTTSNSPLPDNRIWNILYEGNDSIWISTHNAVVLFNSINKTVKIYKHSKDKLKSLPENGINVIKRDKLRRLWVGTMDGLSMMDEKNGTFRNFHQNDGSGLSFNTISDIFNDSKGRMWVGTEFGLNLFDSNTNTFMSFIHSDTNANSLVNNDVHSVNEDKLGRIWVCTRFGICWYNEKEDRFISISHPDLTSMFTYTALDDGNYVWVSTHRGIARIKSYGLGGIKMFDVTDGLQSNEFNPPGIRLADGMFLFGGINGITAFYPDSIKLGPSRIPPLFFTEIKVNGQVINMFSELPSGRNNILKNIESASKITLEPNERLVSFEFTALEYFTPEKIKYFYRVIPGTPNWIPLKDQNFITFIDLQPGKYTFLVRSTNADQIEVANIRTIQLEILAPYYKQLWFVVLGFVFISLIGFLGVKYWYNKVERDKQTLEKLVEERTRKAEIQTREIEIQRNIARHQRDKIAEQKTALEQFAQNLEKKVQERTKELELEKLKAEESDRLKSSFLSNMSHEIRTPMNAIIGFSELLSGQVFEADERKHFVDIIRQNGDHLLDLLNDIIDISMIEAGQLKLIKTTLIMNDLVDEVYLNFKNNRIYIDKLKSIDLLIIPPPQTVIIISDPVRVKQVLLNLISNAFKFTESGSISVTYEENNGCVQFSVVDTGIGIKNEDLSKIFVRFRKLEDDNSVLYGGNGLGLTISRNLIESLGGSMWVESQVGVGTTFYFTLPS